MVNKRIAVLVIDVGGASVRGLLFDTACNLIEIKRYPLCTLTKGAFVEQNPLEMRKHIKAIVKHFHQVAEVRNLIIRALGLAVQRSSIVCWDRQTGDALSPVISWQDTRGGSILTQILKADAGRLAQIRAKTGLYANAHFGASKIQWCLQNLALFSTSKSNNQILCTPLSGFLAAQLNIAAAGKIDPGIAARTLLMNMHTLAWDSDLIKMFAIPTPLLGAIVQNDMVLPAQTVYPTVQATLVIGDQCSVPYANGQPEADTLYINLGTGGFLLQTLPTSIACDGLEKTKLLTTLLGQWGSKKHLAVEATINGVGSALSWFQQRHPLVTMTRYADLAYSDHPDCYFLNGIGGLACPYWQPDFKSDFVNGGNTRDECLAVYESILFLIKVNIEEMQTLGLTQARIKISGGLAQDAAFCQAIADLCELTVQLTITEATSLGVAQILLEKIGSMDYRQDSDAQVEYVPQERIRLKQRYRTWLQLMDSARIEQSNRSKDFIIGDLK